MEPAWKEELSCHPGLNPEGPATYSFMSDHARYTNRRHVACNIGELHIHLLGRTHRGTGSAHIFTLLLHTHAKTSCAQQHLGSHVIHRHFLLRNFPLSRLCPALLPRRIVLFSDLMFALGAMELCLTRNILVSWGHWSHRNPTYGFWGGRKHAHAKASHGIETEGLDLLQPCLEILRGVILDWLGWTYRTSILHLEDKMRGRN